MLFIWEGFVMLVGEGFGGIGRRVLTGGSGVLGDRYYERCSGVLGEAFRGIGRGV